MSEYSIDKLIESSLKGIQSIVNVDTIIGSPVETANQSVIIPVSTVSFGFAAGGSDLPSRKKSDTPEQEKLFAGGSGAGVSVKPVAFLVVAPEQIKLIPVANATNTVVDKVFDMMPTMIDKLNGILSKKKAPKAEPVDVDDEI